MIKKLMLFAAFITFTNASHMLGMEPMWDLDSTPITLYIEDPAVQILIPNPQGAEENNPAQNLVITGKKFKGTTFSVPYSDQIGIKFPGENDKIIYIHNIGE